MLALFQECINWLDKIFQAFSLEFSWRFEILCFDPRDAFVMWVLLIARQIGPVFETEFEAYPRVEALQWLVYFSPNMAFFEAYCKPEASYLDEKL